MTHPHRIALRALAVAGLLAFTTAASAHGPAEGPKSTPREYQIDPVHSTVGFSVRHIVSRMGGNFRDFGGTLTVDPQHLHDARGKFTAKVASIDTGNDKRDGHLRTADFFDVEKYPEITFVITSVEPTGADTAKVKGDFTMHGVTKPVEFAVKEIAFVDMGETAAMGFVGTTTVDRTDYGIVWNKALDSGGVVLGKDVTIDIAVEAKAKIAPPAAAGQ